MRCAGGHFTDRNHRATAQNLVLSSLKLTIRLGELFGKRSRFFANLRRPQREAPTARERGEFLDLRAESLRFTRSSTPHDAADAGTVRFQADPEAMLVRETWRNRVQEP